MDSSLASELVRADAGAASVSGPKEPQRNEGGALRAPLSRMMMCGLVTFKSDPVFLDTVWTTMTAAKEVV